MIEKIGLGLIGVFVLISVDANAQKKYLATNINRPGVNNSIPTISGDGKTMVYLNDYTDDGEVQFVVSYKTGSRWSDARPVENIGSNRLNHIGGHSLSYNGKTLWFTSRRPNSIGRYDIWYVNKRTTGDWGIPRNPGKFVNTEGNEGNPSLSPDGKYLYFSRCNNMEKSKEKECKIFVSEKNRGRGVEWKEPIEVPINLLNESNPKILADNRTLVFASDRAGGKGGMDLYMTRKDGVEWTQPANLSFVNTPKDDRFYSSSFRPDLGYISDLNERNNLAIAEVRVPEQFRSSNVVMITGAVVDGAEGPVEADVRVNDYSSGKLFTSTRSFANDGSFTLILPKGRIYELSVVDFNAGNRFYSEVYDLTALKTSTRENKKINLTTLLPGVEWSLPAADFEDYSSSLKPQSRNELIRIVRMMKRNPTIELEVGAYLGLYKEDSVKSDPDLTEVALDTMVSYDYVRVIDSTYVEETVTLDSVLTVINDSLRVSRVDSTIALGFFQQIVTKDSVENYTISSTYHNDRTEKEAQSLVEFLIQNGVDIARIQPAAYKENEPHEIRKNDVRDRWIKVKVIK